MQIDIDTQNLEITDALRNHVQSKFQRLAHHSAADASIQAHVVLGAERGRFRASAKVRLGAAHIFAEKTTDDMYASIDALIGRLDAQFIKHKEKNIDHRPRR